jgi:hypothetical protein
MTAAALRHARYVVTENPITLVAFSMLLLLLLLALLGPVLARLRPAQERHGEHPAPRRATGSGPTSSDGTC